MRRWRAVMCGHGPGHAHSQIAHCVSDTNRLSPRDQHCAIREALRTWHLAESLMAPLIILCYIFSLFSVSLCCISATPCTFPLWPIFTFILIVLNCSDIALENMHHKVLYNTYPQLVSSRLSPTWREAMPKSAILMLFFSSSNRFSGFRSLWLKDSEMKKINQLMKHERPLLKSYKLVQLMWNEKALLKAYQTPVDQAWIHIQECNWEQLSILTGYRATSSSLQQPLSLISPCWN